MIENNLTCIDLIPFFFLPSGSVKGFAVAGNPPVVPDHFPSDVLLLNWVSAMDLIPVEKHLSVKRVMLDSVRGLGPVVGEDVKE